MGLSWECFNLVGKTPRLSNLLHIYVNGAGINFKFLLQNCQRNRRENMKFSKPVKKKRRLNWEKQWLKRSGKRGVRRREFILMNQEGSVWLLSEISYMSLMNCSKFKNCCE
jgi:hypothetical protein